MTRILIMVPYRKLFPPRNGGQLRCFYLLRELARQHEVHAIILQADRELRQPKDGYVFPESVKIYGPQQTPPPQTLFDRLPGRLGSALQYRWLRRSWRGPANSILLETHHLVRQILAEHNVDVVIFEHLDSAFTAPIVMRQNSRAVRILDAHNVDHQMLKPEPKVGQPDQRDSIDRQYDQTLWQETHLAKLVNAFFACSDDDRKALEALNRGEVKGYTIPNGVDTSMRPFDENPFKKDAQRTLFCGALNTTANREGLLWFHREIWHRIIERCPDLRLVVIGQNANPHDFITLHSDSTVDFVGAVEDVVPYYRQASVAVVPLRSGSGTRLKILEAMSLGNPVVSTGIGAQGIDVVDGEHLLLADEPAAFADAVCRYLADANLFECVRQQARQLVQTTYEWRVIGNQMNAAIANLLQIRRNVESRFE